MTHHSHGINVPSRVLNTKLYNLGLAAGTAHSQNPKLGTWARPAANISLHACDRTDLVTIVSFATKDA